MLGAVPALAQQPAALTQPLPQPGAFAGDEIKVSYVAEPGLKVGWGRATGIVEAPLDKVLAVVQDYGRYAEFMPHFKASRVLSQRGSRALIYLQARIVKNTVTVWAQLKVGPKPDRANTRIIEARMMKGNITQMRAIWELTPVDAGHTLVTFQMMMDPDLPLPASLINNENKKATRRTIQALRKRVAG